MDPIEEELTLIQVKRALATGVIKVLAYLPDAVTIGQIKQAARELQCDGLIGEWGLDEGEDE